MPQNNLTKALPAVRLAIGLGAYALPELTGKIFGFDTENQETKYMARLFGIRDVILGAGVLASSGDARKLWWRLGIVADAGDAGAGYMGLKSGAPKRAMIMSTLTALSAVGMGIAGAGALGGE